MKAREAIVKADQLRPNTLNEEQKREWLIELENTVREVMGLEPVKNLFPQDQELAMPNPHENIYWLYVIALIDYYNQETTQYTNDMILYNEAYAEAIAWWRRNNRPKDKGNWKVY